MEELFLNVYISIGYQSLYNVGIIYRGNSGCVHYIQGFIYKNNVHTNVVYRVQIMPTATNDPHRLIPVTESQNIE
jgi:hypothetical protein